ncbi:hypothetical protein VPH35_011753 [Triticum aestivum]
MRTQPATNITQRSPPPAVEGQSSPAASRSLRLALILGILDRHSLSSEAPRRLPAHAVFADCPARADLANLAAALGSAQLVLAAASGDGSFLCLCRLVAESSSPQIDTRPLCQACRASDMSRMVYTGFTDMWPSRLRMRSTRMRTVHRAVPAQQSVHAK